MLRCFFFFVVFLASSRLSALSVPSPFASDDFHVLRQDKGFHILLLETNSVTTQEERWKMCVTALLPSLAGMYEAYTQGQASAESLCSEEDWRDFWVMFLEDLQERWQECSKEGLKEAPFIKDQKESIPSSSFSHVYVYPLLNEWLAQRLTSADELQHEVPLDLFLWVPHAGASENPHVSIGKQVEQRLSDQLSGVAVEDWDALVSQVKAEAKVHMGKGSHFRLKTKVLVAEFCPESAITCPAYPFVVRPKKKEKQNIPVPDKWPAVEDAFVSQDVPVKDSQPLPLEKGRDDFADQRGATIQNALAKISSETLEVSRRVQQELKAYVTSRTSEAVAYRDLAEHVVLLCATENNAEILEKKNALLIFCVKKMDAGEKSLFFTNNAKAMIDVHLFRAMALQKDSPTDIVRLLSCAKDAYALQSYGPKDMFRNSYEKMEEIVQACFKSQSPDIVVQQGWVYYHGMPDVLPERKKTFAIFLLDKAASYCEAMIPKEAQRSSKGKKDPAISQVLLRDLIFVLAGVRWQRDKDFLEQQKLLRDKHWAWILAKIERSSLQEREFLWDKLSLSEDVRIYKQYANKDIYPLGVLMHYLEKKLSDVYLEHQNKKAIDARSWLFLDEEEWYELMKSRIGLLMGCKKNKLDDEEEARAWCRAVFRLRAKDLEGSGQTPFKKSIVDGLSVIAGSLKPGCKDQEDLFFVWALASAAMLGIELNTKKSFLAEKDFVQAMEKGLRYTGTFSVKPWPLLFITCEWARRVAQARGENSDTYEEAVKAIGDRCSSVVDEFVDKVMDENSQTEAYKALKGTVKDKSYLYFSLYKDKAFQHLLWGKWLQSLPRKERDNSLARAKAYVDMVLPGGQMTLVWDGYPNAATIQVLTGMMDPVRERYGIGLVSSVAFKQDVFNDAIWSLKEFDKNNQGLVLPASLAEHPLLLSLAYMERFFSSELPPKRRGRLCVEQAYQRWLALHGPEKLKDLDQALDAISKNLPESGKFKDFVTQLQACRRSA